MLKVSKLKYLDFTIAAAAVLLAACVATNQVDLGAVEAQQHDFPEDSLLDVGIRIFDPNVPADLFAAEKQGVYPNIRKAESLYMPYMLKEAMEVTGNWGTVRVLPRASAVSDLFVTGRILNSRSHKLALQIEATDASGEVWFKRNYSAKLPPDHYEAVSFKSESARKEPFYALYVDIANDLLHHRLRLQDEKVHDLRRLAEMEFARVFSPDIYDRYVQVNGRGIKTLVRFPAREDPIFQRLGDIRAREYMFIDLADRHKADFYGKMAEPYREWRELSHGEYVAARKEKKAAFLQTLLGIFTTLGGVIAAAGSDNYAELYGSSLLMEAGMQTVVGGVEKGRQAKVHAALLSDMALSFDVEMAPQTLTLEDRLVTLTGSVDQQYKAWRTLISELYVLETEPDPNVAQTANDATSGL